MLVLITLPFIYYHHRAENPNIYLQFLTATVILIFGYATYEFQEKIKEFNRLSKIPALNVDRDELEKHKVIYIENKNDYLAKNVYIGSFLFTGDGTKNEILYDEIQLQIVKAYPIIQSNILKQNFRAEFEEEDEKKENYGSTLKNRMQSFIQENTDPYLVIALRGNFMNTNETLLFFYECKYTDSDARWDTLSFTSKHFSARDQLHKKAFEKINKKYKEYCKKYKKNLTWQST